MFIFSLTYIAPLEEVQALRSAHLDWLAAGRDAGHFAAWGRKEPLTGGMIFATVESLEEAQKLAATDPFIKGGVATAEVFEFNATFAGDGLEALLK